MTKRNYHMPLSLNNNASDKDITKLVLFLKKLLESNTLIGCFSYHFSEEDNAKTEYIIKDYKSNSNIIVFNENIHMNTYIFSSDIDYTNNCRNVRSDLIPNFISKNQLTPSVYCQIYDVLIHTQTPDTYKNESFKRPISRSFVNIKFLRQLISPLIINELRTQNEKSQLLENLLSNQFNPIETHIQTAFTGIFQDIRFSKSSNIVEYYF